MSWIDNKFDAPGQKLVLSPSAKARALPFAIMGRDVYSGKSGDQSELLREGAVRKFSWLEVMESPQEQATFSTLDKLEVALGDLLGFNAAIYSLQNSTDACWVIAYEGTRKASKASSPGEAMRTTNDWLLANTSANLWDKFNKANEPRIDSVFRMFTPFGAFADFLNPRRSPATQYDLADLLANSVRRRHRKVILTGHSKGGGMAQYAAMRNGLRAIAFNTAGTGATAASAEAPYDIVRINTESTDRRDLDLRHILDYKFNTFVTDSDKLSRQHGALYLIGKGGHGIDDVIRLLREG